MKEGRSALRYAKALLNLAKENNVAEAVNNDMKLIQDTIKDSSDLQLMLHSPVIDAASKTKVLNTLFADKLNNVTKGLFQLLEDNKRLTIIETITKQYSVIYDYDNDIRTAKVTTAVALTDELEQKIQAKVVELTGSKATIESVIDPAILGGFILRVGDIQYDASVSNKLRELKKEFSIN